MGNLQDFNPDTSPEFIYEQYSHPATVGISAETIGATGAVVSIAQGGTGANNAAAALVSLGAAKSGANSDLTSITNLTGDVILNAVGATLKIKEGANASMGVATMAAGTATVNNTRIAATSRIFLTPQNTSGTAGSVYISARTASTSFVISSTDAGDTRDVAWLIITPA